MKLKDVKAHFFNGCDVIVSGRYEGEEERYLFKNGFQLTEEHETLYRKNNSDPLPVIDIHEQTKAKQCPGCGTWG